MEIEFIDEVLEEPPKNVKDRIIGKMYMYQNQIRIWSGRILNCQHNRQKNFCKDCGGQTVCEHRKIRGICKDCGGSQLCIHGIRKIRCKKCDGSQYCEHDCRKDQCKFCGTSYCEHGKRKSICKICKGSDICEHNTNKYQCKDCKGKSLCVHLRQKAICRECYTHPRNFCKSCTFVSILGSPYKPYCFRCYCKLNPDEEIPHRYMMKENYIHDYLKENLVNIELIHNKTIRGGCSKRRPDWMIDMLTHVIFIECDENKHADYQCENKRMMEMFIDIGNRPIIMIRFNPDEFKGKRCFKFGRRNKIVPTKIWNVRKEELLKIIKNNITNIPDKELTIIRLNFD